MTICTSISTISDHATSFVQSQLVHETFEPIVSKTNRGEREEEIERGGEEGGVGVELLMHLREPGAGGPAVPAGRLPGQGGGAALQEPALRGHRCGLSLLRLMLGFCLGTS